MNRIIIFIFIVIILLSNSCTVVRGVVYNKPSVDDYKKFCKAKFEHYQIYGENNNAQKSKLSYINTSNTNIYNKRVSDDFIRKTNTSVVVFYKNNTIIYSKFNDFDECEIHAMFSISKSIVSLLIGIAIEEGYIKSENDLIVDYIPSLHKTLNYITIKDLLQMRSGICNNFITKTNFYYGHNMYKSVKKLKADKRQKGIFQYSDGSTQILATIIEKSTKQNFEDYFYYKLWKPLKMEYNGYWCYDSPRNNNIVAASGLCISTTDLIKIGELILNNGQKDGKEIVPKKWIEKCLNIEIKEPTYIDGYSYNLHWRGVNNGEVFAKGLFGQYLYINTHTGFMGIRLGSSNKYNIDWVEIFKECDLKY